MKINDIVHGFRLNKQEEIKEIGVEAFVFEHIKSGARLLYLKNDDENKVFSVSFRTPPTDDTGVAHIIEHSTLCGSRKFPLKEPFVELVKGSLNTFLNAMTFPDKTMYPIASMNDKDFQNLMDVYLDAVFYPRIYDKPEILMQEGWHYELESPDAPLEYSGVVYNEMKGALSDPANKLFKETFAAVFPDTLYRHESGGDPEAIPDLSYEQFKEFHEKYYSPANSYIYLYGKMDVEEKLKFMDEEYLSHFDRIEVDSSVGEQKPFDKPIEKYVEYPIGEDDDDTAKTFLNYTAVICDSEDRLTSGAVSILLKTILDSDGSPVRQALMDAEIGMDIDSSVEDGILQPVLQITVNGSEKSRLEKFKTVLMDSFREQVRNGIDKERLEASLNIFEFRLREADFGPSPKGLVYNILAMSNWLYDGDPLVCLRYEEFLAKLREGVSTDFYEKILQEYVIDNKHSAFVVMSPSKTMAAERDARIKEKLSAIKAKMGQDEIQRVIDEAARLKAMQQTPDSPEALASIPLLEIKDIDRNPQKFPLEEREINGIKTLFSDVETNGIVYLNIYFDFKVVPQEMLQYAYLLTDMLGAVDTDAHSYSELTVLEGIHTGGIDFSMDAMNRVDKIDEYSGVVSVKGKSFVRKLPEMLSLMGEICSSSRFDDKKRLKELVQSEFSSLQMAMIAAPLGMVTAKLSANVSPAAAINYINTLPKYRFLKGLMDNFDGEFDNLSRKLSEIAKLLFTRDNVMVGITVKEDLYSQFAAEFGKFLDVLPEGKAPEQKYVWDFAPRQEAFSSTSQIQYVAKGYSFRKLGYKLPGTAQVLNSILKYDYFWNRIRVQGGAYGAMTKMDQDGEIIFMSYRDPNLKATIDVFDSTGDYIANFDATDREMRKYIIGTISRLDIVTTPRTIGSIARGLWFMGITYEDREQIGRAHV